MPDRRLPISGNASVRYPHIAGSMRGTLGLTLLAAAAWLVGGSDVHAQPGSVPGATVSAPAKTASSTGTRPLWSELSTAQQQALAPLAPHWNTLVDLHKRKWLALSRNFSKMTPEDQAILHSRMTEWAALSPQQRMQARLNFAEVKRLAPPDERKAKWEAYQALSAEEKRQLAERAAPRPRGAATPIRPVPAQKLAPVPTTALRGQPTPRIELAPPPMAPEPLPTLLPAQPLPSTTADAKMPGAANTTPPAPAASAAPAARMIETPAPAP